MTHDPSDSLPLLNPNQADFPHEFLLEQYKLYVEMHDKISERRNQMNSFYVSLLSGIFGVFSIVVNQNVQSGNLLGSFPFWGVIIGFLGLSLCLLWNLGIRAYARLVERKIIVIQEMEAYLPFRCYIREGQLRMADMRQEKLIKHVRITKLERYSSVLFGVVYLMLMIYSLVLLVV